MMNVVYLCINYEDNNMRTVYFISEDKLPNLEILKPYPLVKSMRDVDVLLWVVGRVMWSEWYVAKVTKFHWWDLLGNDIYVTLVKR